MSVYIVRIRQTREVVGIFNVDDIHKLPDLVDECTDPNSCERARLQTGGMYWERGAPLLPLGAGEADDAPLPKFPEPLFAGEWHDALIGGGRLNWKPVVAAEMDDD